MGLWITGIAVYVIARICRWRISEWLEIVFAFAVLFRILYL